MADVFISYKKEDAGRVIRIVEALRAEGLSVWWDHGIQAGAQWDQTIKHELDSARMVVAVWSEASVSAPWVKEEANVGKARGVLLPARIDDVDPPLGFTLIQAADLVAWDGNRRDQRFVFFLSAVRAVLAGEAPAGLDAPIRKRRRPIPLAGIALGFIMVVITLLLLAIVIPSFMTARSAAQSARERSAPTEPATPAQR